MDIRQIEKLMRTMQEHGVTSLELTEGETRLFLTRQEPTMVQLPIETTRQHIIAQAEEPPPAAKKEAVAGKEVLAPMVGTYHARTKDAVKVGSKLKKGDVLCVIEAMKLMNDIVMEEDGEITHIALKEGEMVEYGQPIAQYRALS